MYVPSDDDREEENDDESVGGNIRCCRDGGDDDDNDNDDNDEDDDDTHFDGRRNDDYNDDHHDDSDIGDNRKTTERTNDGRSNFVANETEREKETKSGVGDGDDGSVVDDNDVGRGSVRFNGNFSDNDVRSRGGYYLATGGRHSPINFFATANIADSLDGCTVRVNGDAVGGNGDSTDADDDFDECEDTGAAVVHDRWREHINYVDGKSRRPRNVRSERHIDRSLRHPVITYFGRKSDGEMIHMDKYGNLYTYSNGRTTISDIDADCAFPVRESGVNRARRTCRRSTRIERAKRTARSTGRVHERPDAHVSRSTVRRIRPDELFGSANVTADNGNRNFGPDDATVPSVSVDTTRPTDYTVVRDAVLTRYDKLIVDLRNARTHASIIKFTNDKILRVKCNISVDDWPDIIRCATGRFVSCDHLFALFASKSDLTSLGKSEFKRLLLKLHPDKNDEQNSLLCRLLFAKVHAVYKTF